MKIEELEYDLNNKNSLISELNEGLQKKQEEIV